MKERKTGGRQAGTPNKRTQNLIELIDKYHKGFNPVLELIEICKAEDTPIDLKVNILKEVAPYLYPKRKAIELSEADSQQDNGITITFVDTDEKYLKTESIP